ncbi:MAG: hypothetical protein ACK2UO_10920 [Caldilineaceae bacterium]
MSDSVTPQEWNERKVHIPTPNLQVMLHHYSRVEYLFKTITMYADDDREQMLDDIVAIKTWYWGRYAPENRRQYLENRLFVEACMYEAFSRKYCPPKQRCPVFFYLYPNLSLSLVEERLYQRRQYDETDTKYLLVDLQDVLDTTYISFTLCDSHRSYREALIQQGLLPGEKSQIPAADYGTVFHIQEIAAVYARHQAEDDLYFEVQVWDSEVLERWKAAHKNP